MIGTAFTNHLHGRKQNLEETGAQGSIGYTQTRSYFPIAKELHQEYLETEKQENSSYDRRTSEDRLRWRGRQVKGRAYWFHYWTTTACALFVLPVNAYVFISLWIPDGINKDPPFYVIPTAAVSVIAAGVPYWMMLSVYKASRSLSDDEETFVIDRRPVAERIDGQYCIRRERLEQRWHKSELKRDPV